MIVLAFSIGSELIISTTSRMDFAVRSPSLFSKWSRAVAALQAPHPDTIATHPGSCASGDDCGRQAGSQPKGEGRDVAVTARGPAGYAGIHALADFL